MNGRTTRPFLGRLEAAGFLIDPGHVGIAEARRRIVESWASGAQLFDFGNRFLLLVPEPVSVRAEHAPGLPVLVQDGKVVLVQHGTETLIAPEMLEPIDLNDIVDLTDLRLDFLEPAPEQVQAAPPIEHRPEPARASVRARAGIGTAAPDTARRAERLLNEMSTHAAQSTSARRNRWFRPPVTPMLRRRHARYLDKLAKSFESRDWDEALRSAIALGGNSQGAWTTRVPGRRRGPLQPATKTSSGGGSVPYGQTVHKHLHDLYTDAAKQLEAAGQHLQAAFVYADLLDNTTAAIDLLERHRFFVEAAELAEARGQDPAVAVRLWWRAGDRARAVQVASRRGAYAAAVSRLDQVDPDAALALRREWMHDRRQAGDPLGAITAAWPAEGLRPETVPDIGAAMALGGSTAGEALAHWLELAATDQAADVSRALLAGDPDLVVGRRAFVTALSTHRVSEPALDRELTSVALLALARDSTAVPNKAFHDVSARLQKRADPLLVADLPRLKVPLQQSAEPVTLDATTGGNVAIHDAVAIGDNSVLVALGELGVQLLTLDGRIRARWDVPTHRLVISDYGNRVLLIAHRAPRFLVHQLDLPHARPTPLPDLDAMPLDTYDGTRPVLVSERGIEWVEQDGDRWRLAWRELTEPGQRIHQVSRTARSMTALFTEAELSVFQWELPSLMLRQRGTVEPAQSVVVVATGEAGRFHQESGVAALDWHAVFGHRMTTTTLHPEGEAFVMVSGSAFAVGDQTETGLELAIHRRRDSGEAATLLLPPGSRPLFRAAGGVITTGHAAGRIVVIDAEVNGVTADITVRA